MKKVEAIIRPMRLEAVKAALAEESDIVGMTVTDVRGLVGADEGTGPFGGVALAPKVKLELAVPDGRVQSVVDLLMTHARTGLSGDGKIFVSALGDAVRIRTGDRGDAAVS